ncbi:MAG: hypothetical protein ACE5F6_16950 [Anaerolineae bacterium]
MKRSGGIFLAVLLVVLALLASSAGHSNSIYAQSAEGPGSTEVVIFTCIPLGRLQDGLTVERISRSVGAATVSLRSDCAQALANLLSEGYSIADIEFFAGNQALYTLVKE